MSPKALWDPLKGQNRAISYVWSPLQNVQPTWHQNTKMFRPFNHVELRGINL